MTLPHAETAYEAAPRWLERSPRPVRFACSVLEVGLPPITSGRRWSIDQWTPPQDPAYRMGGVFGAYAVVAALAIAFAALRRRTREARLAGVVFAAATAVASVLPQSHELRYYLFWMLLAVALALVLWADEAPRATAAAALAAFAVVAGSTRGSYLYPSGDSFAHLLATRVDHEVVANAREGEQICVAREPWSFLYAPVFHPGARFTVREAKSESDCVR